MRNSIVGPVLVAAIVIAAGELVRDHVVIVANDRVLEGDVERLGDRIVIRRGESEASIPASQALFIGPDLKSAYKFLQTKADLNRVEERLRLARWCHENGLRSEAVIEIDAALNIKPNWLPALTLLQQIKQGPAKPPPPKPVEAATTPADAVDCSPEAVKLFGTKVQPILMNACAGCHASSKSGTFELRRVNVIGPVNQDNSQFNLAASMRQVDRKYPAKSPFLVKAVTAHAGMSNPAIKDTNTPAFKHLEQWVRLLSTETKTVEPQSKANPQAPQGTAPKDEFDPKLFNRKKDG